MKTVVFDFDGVIHSYFSGWKGYTVITDPPVPGIKEAIAAIRRNGYEVVVVSSRCAYAEGRKAISDYLDKYEIKVDKIVKEKPPAIVYIDDRAICFDGNASALLKKIEEFTPWNKSNKGLHWIDNADSYICPVCGNEVGNPAKLEECKCNVCGFQDEKDTSEEGCANLCDTCFFQTDRKWGCTSAKYTGNNRVGMIRTCHDYLKDPG